MNILNIIKNFEREYDYLERDKYKSVFSSANLIMEYFTQKRSLEINSLDDAQDALYAAYAYRVIQDPKTDQHFCNYDELSEYSSILNKYLKGKNEFEIMKMISAWMFLNKSSKHKN